MRDLLQRLATYGRDHGVPVELCYHPDADPGDGSGWSVLIGDRYYYGEPVDALTTAGVLPAEFPHAQ